MAEASTVLGQQMFAMALGWQIYDLTNSPLSLGLMGLVQFFPQFFFALLAGHAADRYDRRRVALLCQVLFCGVALTLCYANFTGRLDSTLIYVCTFLIGTGQAFQNPALRSIMPLLTSAEDLPRAIAWSATVRKFSVVVGPAAAGVIYMGGPGIVYLVGSVAFAMAVMMMANVRLPQQPKRVQPFSIESLLGGLKYVWKSPVLFGAISLDLFAMLLGGATALLPIYAKDILETGPWGLGLLRSAPAVGGVITSVYLVHNPITRRAGALMFAGIGVFGIATIIFGISTWFPLSLAMLAIMGAADMLSVVIRGSLLQLETPDNMRGRVSSVNSLFVNASNQLGQFESGVTAAWWGAVPSVVVGGVGTVLIVALWIRWFPQLAKRDKLTS
jgi:MFS family permease